MLKGIQKDNLDFLQKPRKLIKLNVAQDDNYNQFKGDYLEEKDVAFMASMRQKRNEPEVQFSSIDDQNKRDKNIFQLIKSNTTANRKIRSIADATKSIPNNSKGPQEKEKTKETQKSTEKVDNKSIEKAQPEKKKNPKPQKQVNGLSNWKKFQTDTSNIPKQSKIQNKKHDQFIAIDCQFVKSGQEQLLARISLVNENGDCRLDSYVHPEKKITDYVTNISGITYGHIKNAPSTKKIIDQVKSILYNKIVVGHTAWKDLEVCGLKNWKGMKAIIDISEFTPYQQKSGKLISLKNLCTRFLGKKIQEGHHSSTQDANATMSLFLLKKKQILKHFKLIV